MKEWLEEMTDKKEEEFRVQFKDSIQIMAGALKAGYSAENAIRETCHDLKPMYKSESRIIKEYEIMIRKLKIHIPVGQVLSEFAENVEQEDVDNFVTVFTTAQKSGGDSIVIIKDAVKVISEKMETEKEIQTMIASKKLEFEIMSMIPFGMIGYMKLTAKLKYKEQSEKYEFYVRIFPARESKKEKIVRELKEAVQKEEEDTRTEKYLILPDEINGTKITWSHEKNSGTVGILIAGGGAAVMVFVSENQKKKEKKKRESEEMRRDYPQIINRFSLYIGAGMSVRNAWQRITEDYRKNKERTGRRKAYEEMIYTENQMKNKAAESECYEEYGIRCGLSVYRRFGTLLSQNLRKGSKGLSELLKRETGEMFEERKKQARKLGEEAGTKLMIPLFMMLAVVFIIVIVPAFFTIQI